MTDAEKQTASDNSIYYILGGVVLVAAVAGFFLLRPKTSSNSMTGTNAPSNATAQASPTPAPITKLACGSQYYNPRIGYPEYYLSVQGEDTNTSGKVTCAYSISVKDTVVKTASATGDLVAAPGRGGATFRCITDALQLAKGVPTKVDVTVTNPSNQSVTCSKTYVLP